MYPITLFVHIASAIAMFAAITIELAGLAGVRRATTAPQLQESLRLLGSLRRVGGPSMLLLLASGIDLAVTGRQRGAWLMVALAAIVVMIVIGVGFTRKRMRTIVQAAASAERGLPISLQDRLRDPVLYVAAWLRAAIVIGIVYDMTVKPALAGSVAAIAVAMAAGALVAMRLGRPPALAAGAAPNAEAFRRAG